MIPEYVSRRLWTVSNDACKVDCWPAVHVHVRGPNYSRLRRWWRKRCDLKIKLFCIRLFSFLWNIRASQHTINNILKFHCFHYDKCIIFHWNILTKNIQANDERFHRFGWNLAFIVARISYLSVPYLQYPIFGILAMNHLWTNNNSN